jgi:hypothetical protein
MMMLLLVTMMTMMMMIIAVSADNDADIVVGGVVAHICRFGGHDVIVAFNRRRQRDRSTTKQPGSDRQRPAATDLTTNKFVRRQPLPSSCLPACVPACLLAHRLLTVS